MGGGRLPGIGKYRGDYLDLRTLRAAPERPPAGFTRLFVKGADGDAYQLEADGTETALAGGGGGGGAPTTAPYLTTAADAGLSAEVVIPGLAASPDIRVAGASDDEFDTTDTTDPMTGWTTLGAPTAHNINSTALSHYYLKRNSNATNDVVGIYKAVPGLPDTVTCKITDAVLAQGSARIGLMIGVSPPGAMVVFGLAGGGPTGTGPDTGVSYGMIVDNWTNPTTYGSTRTTQVDARAYRYFRFVVASSTDVTAQFSENGKLWITFGTANFNPGFTVAVAGIVANAPASGAAAEGIIDWIRFS